MKVAIMQPYFFPYIGYFQLINAVDKFIIYDDVNYINKGWINRNNILVNGKSNLFTLPLKEASQNKKINEIVLIEDTKWKLKFLQTISQNYKKAKNFESVFPLIEKSINSEEKNISKYNTIQIKTICEYLNITTEIISSSTIYNNRHLKASERILDICLKEKAKIYINPSGGTNLYSVEYFMTKGIDLVFLKSKSIIYKQLSNDFIPWLSVIDLLMFNDINSLTYILKQFELN